jgi:carbon storage regulator CsrA
MLVLTRKLQQQIKIGEQITVTILRVKGNTVRVGVEAPREVRVVRGELPKLGEAAEETETIEVQSVVVVTNEDGEIEETVEVDAGAAGQPAATSAAHLPLRRIHNRYGKAPLKQVIAACGTLAK